VELRTTFLQRYASEAGGDAAFGLQAQWRRTDFECADPPCGVDQPAKAWRALGSVPDTGRKDGTATLFSSYSCCASVVWKTDSGGSRSRRLTCQPVAMLFSGASNNAGGQDWTGVGVCGCCAAEWHWWSRGGNISGLAWRYANSLEQDTGPLGWECR
jgi:hypothetical protein